MSESKLWGHAWDPDGTDQVRIMVLDDGRVTYQWNGQPPEVAPPAEQVGLVSYTGERPIGIAMHILRWKQAVCPPPCDAEECTLP